MYSKYEISDDRVQELTNRYTYHMPKTDEAASQEDRYVQIRMFALNLAFALEEMCPQSRELVLAHTNLEQVVFWANASIARNE